MSCFKFINPRYGVYNFHLVEKGRQPSSKFYSIVYLAVAKVDVFLDGNIMEPILGRLHNEFSFDFKSIIGPMFGKRYSL